MFLFLSTLLFAHFSSVSTCGAGAGGDYTFVKTPVFTMQLAPPVGWTFFPVKPSDAAAVVWYFVGQSNNSVQAEKISSAEIVAAMTEALVTANIPLQGVTITDNYTPFQVENPGILTMGVGPLYGKVEAGAVTQTAPGVANTAFVWQPFSQAVQVDIANSIGATMYNWNIVKNTFMQKLTLNYNARFAGDITVTGQ